MSFLETRSRYLRRNTTVPEQLLWDRLKGSAFGTRFYSQHMLHGYIVDFWAPARKLVIEVDGARHRSRKEQDSQRDQVLHAHGVEVLRFPAQLMYADLNFVLDRIREKLSL